MSNGHELLKEARRRIRAIEIKDEHAYALGLAIGVLYQMRDELRSGVSRFESPPVSDADQRALETLAAEAARRFDAAPEVVALRLVAVATKSLLAAVSVGDAANIATQSTRVRGALAEWEGLVGEVSRFEAKPSEREIACAAWSPKGFACTMLTGHDGEHVAMGEIQGTTATVYDRWPQARRNDAPPCGEGNVDKTTCILVQGHDGTHYDGIGYWAGTSALKKKVSPIDPTDACATAFARPTEEDKDRARRFLAVNGTMTQGDPQSEAIVAALIRNIRVETERGRSKASTSLRWRTQATSRRGASASPHGSAISSPVSPRRTREAVAVWPGQIVRSTSLHDKGRRYVVRSTNGVIFQPVDAPRGDETDAMTFGSFVMNFESDNGEPLEERRGRPDAPPKPSPSEREKQADFDECVEWLKAWLADAPGAALGEGDIEELADFFIDRLDEERFDTFEECAQVCDLSGSIEGQSLAASLRARRDCRERASR